VVDKRKTSAWSGTALDEMISPEAEVIVVGCASDSCVYRTCMDAVGRGNAVSFILFPMFEHVLIVCLQVILIRDAHCSYDRAAMYSGPHNAITSAKVIEHEVECRLEDEGVIVMDMDDVDGLFDGR
jgi:hypothetical protein